MHRPSRSRSSRRSIRSLSTDVTALGLRIAGTFGLLAAAALPALAVAPRLANILPPGGQRGTETEVVLSGQRLEDAQEVLFYSQGLEATKLEPGTNRVKVTLRIQPGCRLGEHTLRLRTRTGISEARTFWVGALTNLAEVEPNSELAKAQRLPLNATVHGTIPSEDVDHFTVTATKGSRLSAEIEGMRLGRGAFDPYIAILDRQGRMLQGSEDTPLGFQDGFVSIVVPQDGEYVVQVRDTAYAGKEDYHYRLHVGTFPRPAAVAPIAAQAGHTAKVRFLGDALGPIEQEIPIPAAPAEKFGAFAPDAPSPNWMRVTPFPTTAETEPNDTREQAASASPAPVVFTGVLSAAGDHDWFKFHARKGQSLQVNVYARRLRSPLDSMIQVVNPKGSVIGDNDDANGPDSAITFKADDDGDYAVLVRDQLKRGGPHFTYCIEVAPVEPSLTVKFPEVARNDSQSRQYAAVPRGNRFATLVSLKRTAAPGEIRFSAKDLPKGLKLLPLPMPGKVDQFPLVFEADADAPIEGGLIDLIASATNGVTGRYQNDIELVQGPNNTSYYGTRVDRLAAAVTEAAPFRLRLEQPKVPLVQGGSMELKVIAERDPGFEEAISVQLLWKPPGVSALPDMTIPKGSNSITYVLNAKTDADLHAWPLVAIASAKVRDGDLFIASRPATLEVGEPFLAATMERSACEPGQTTNIVVKLDQKIPFTGRATIRIAGLSDKIIVPEKQITQNDKEVVFPVKVDPTCPPGSQRNLFCTVSIPKDGALIPHSVAAGGSFRVTPPKKAPEPAPKKVAARN